MLQPRMNEMIFFTHECEMIDSMYDLNVAVVSSELESYSAIGL